MRLDLVDVPFAYPFGDRLQPDLERALARTDACTCLLGTEGLSARPADPRRAERVEAEAGLHLEVFGKPVAQFVRQSTG